jgi:pimeloyl-ACP methyl ester carboxylesterase
MRTWVRGLFTLVGVLLLGFGVFVVWWLQPFKAGAVARAALGASQVASTKNPDALVLSPKNPNGTGLIFYPGARVDPDAYAPALSAVAQAGYTVFIARMPLNLAVLGPTRADEIISANSSIQRWAIAGHSLGGAMACSYVNNSDAKNSSRIKTLILWAAYCAESFDLSKSTDLRVTNISGSNDGVATAQKQEANKIYAPSSTKYVVIEGMNHAQFGDYGPQDGDKPATLENDVATQQLVAAMLEALRETK